MAEPYMPFFHVYLRRSASAPVERDQGCMVKIRISMFDYICGDRFVSWEVYSTTPTRTCRAETALQFVRGKMMHISDRWHPRFFDIPRTVETGKPVLRDDILLGDDEIRQKDLEFAARIHDFQQGRFNLYFAFGRTGRIHETCAWDPDEATWRLLTIYDLAGRNSSND